MMGVGVNNTRVATIARTTSLAVDDSLGIETNRGWVKSTIEDVESVSNG